MSRWCWGLWGRSWGLLGGPWGVARWSWGLLGRSLALVRRSWSELGASWGLLRWSWGDFGASWCDLGRPGGGPGGALGWTEAVLKPSWRASCGKTVFGIFFGRFGGRIECPPRPKNHPKTVCAAEGGPEGSYRPLARSTRSSKKHKNIGVYFCRESPCENDFLEFVFRFIARWRS